MTWVLEETAVSNTSTGETKSLSFLSTPVSGELLVFQVMVNNNVAASLAADAGIETAIAPNGSTFRTVATYYRVAGGSETNSYGFSMDAAFSANQIIIFGRRWSGETFDSVGNVLVTHEATTTDTVSAAVSATAGSLVVAQGYTTVTDTKIWSNATGGTWANQQDGGTSDRQSIVALESAGATETATLTLDTQTNNRLTVATAEFLIATGSSLVIDDAPAQIRSSDTGLTITVSGVTESNITNISQVDVRLVDASGPQLTPTNYNYDSATVVTITFSVPASLAIQYDLTGYAVYLDLNTETISTSAIPYLPVSTKDFINLAGTIVKSVAWVSGGDYVDTTEVYDPNDNLVYTSNGVTNSTTAPNADAVNFTYLRPHQSLADGWDEDEPVVGTQAVYDSSTVGGSTITPAADGTYTIDPAVTTTDTFTNFFIEADGTVGDPATITIDPGDTPAPGEYTAQRGISLRIGIGL